MKGLFIAIILLLLFSCGASRRQPDRDANILAETQANPDIHVNRDHNSPKVTPRSGSAGIRDEEVFSDTIQIKSIVDYLASDQLEGRESGGNGIEEAARYIENFFENNGVEKYFVSYRDTLSNIQIPAYNLVGLVPGKDKELSEQFIIIGAHYDHVGIISSGTEDKIANGANDNASGTTTVLELARYFGKYRPNKRSLLFVLFSAEEKGLLGSSHLARRLKLSDFNLYTMLNFEMTGVPLVNSDYLLFLTGFERSNLAELCNKYAGEKLVGFLPQAKQFNLFQRSDNYPFHQAFMVPSQTYCTFDFTNYDHYHKVGDEASRLDFEHMSKVINKMIPVIEGLSNTTDQEIKYY